jgi:type VI secretion system protein ImpM
MLSGLYGKLPMKRDFITVSVPDAFLDLWEPWLQGGLTTSREELGARWEEVFLKAPIWRFWLGPDLCGLATIGSFMPSVDEVGRFFPLTAFACAEKGASFPAPQRNPQSDWFGAAEAMLLEALDDGVEYDAVLARLQALPAPAIAGPAQIERGVRELGAARVARAAEPGQLDGAFAALADDRERRMDAAGCFFWTIGGEDFPVVALHSAGLPDPSVLTTLLSGDDLPMHEDLPA